MHGWATRSEYREERHQCDKSGGCKQILRSRIGGFTYLRRFARDQLEERRRFNRRGHGSWRCTIQANVLNRLRRFLRENGCYVLATSLVEFTRSAVRNSLISRKLGVKKIRIGPAAHLRGLSFIEMGEDFSSGRGLWLEAI